MTSIVDASDGHFSRILELNAAAVEFTSTLDQSALSRLNDMACYHKVAVSGGQVAAFLLALREGAPYQSDNYRYFNSAFDQFVYVDRIVVAGKLAGRGIGSRLYEDLFDFARRERIPRVACEYSVEPPNPASKAFHNSFGFQEVGTQWVANATKQVSLQIAQT